MPEDMVIGFAEEQDEEELTDVLAVYSLGIPGYIEEQLIAKAEGEILAGAKLAQTGEEEFFLEVLGVRQDHLAQGIGERLMTKILNSPWQCCRYPLSEAPPRAGFSVKTLARGGASAFYGKLGFKPCAMHELPEEYQEQCDECPDKEQCNPVPMIYVGGKTL